jgi:hypothetical protein
MLRWAVPLNDKTRSKLSEDELQLGSLHQAVEGNTVLAFRDRFVALKVATRARRPGTTCRSA